LIDYRDFGLKRDTGELRNNAHVGLALVNLLISDSTQNLLSE